MAFAEKLKQLIDAAVSDEGGRTGVLLRVFASKIAETLREGSWGELPRKQEQALAEALVELRNDCKTLDAGLFVRELLQGANARVIDLRARDDFRQMQGAIDDVFASGTAPRRGFVYVAWRRSPEDYFYVGKAGSPDRLNLAGHGKLTKALGSATCLSLVFPARSREGTLLELEASIIELIAHYRGEYPELNDRDGRIPHVIAQAALDQLAGFLETTAKRLRADR